MDKGQTHQLVSLYKAWVLDMKSIRRNPRQSRIIQHHHTISIVHKSLRGEKRIVRLNDNVG